MTTDQGPAWDHHRENPLAISVDGVRYRCYVTDGGVSSAGPAMDTVAQWVCVSPDGVHEAIGLANPGDDEALITRMLQDWRRGRGHRQV